MPNCTLLCRAQLFVLCNFEILFTLKKYLGFFGVEVRTTWVDLIFIDDLMHFLAYRSRLLVHTHLAVFNSERSEELVFLNNITYCLLMRIGHDYLSTRTSVSFKDFSLPLKPKKTYR